MLVLIIIERAFFLKKGEKIILVFFFFFSAIYIFLIASVIMVIILCYLKKNVCNICIYILFTSFVNKLKELSLESFVTNRYRIANSDRILKCAAYLFYDHELNKCFHLKISCFVNN